MNLIHFKKVSAIFFNFPFIVILYYKWESKSSFDNVHISYKIMLDKFFMFPISIFIFI